MPNPKRERQKQGRQLAVQEQRAAEQRSQRMRQFRAVALVILAIVGVAVLISVLGGDDDQQVATEQPTDATTEPTEPTEPPPTAPPPTYSDPELAEEVIARGPPEDAEGPPEDLEADALEIDTVIEGSGRPIREGDSAVVHYYGVLDDGTSFDDSWSRGQPFELTVPGSVIDGWNEGLIGARIGERRRLDIGSELAYGPQGQPPTIPPDAPLAFVIDIVDVVRPEASQGGEGGGGGGEGGGGQPTEAEPPTEAEEPTEAESTEATEAESTEAEEPTGEGGQ